MSEGHGMLGELIKGYRVTKRLGQGAMGEVWMAEQPLVGIKVAIKVLLGQWANDPDIVQRFFDEARAVSRVKHAGVAKIHDVGFHHGVPYLIMELLEGETLADRLTRAGRLPRAQLAEIGAQIASTLEAIHAAKIVHRDLKPENIFLVPDDEPRGRERAKLFDFGIAKLGSAVGRTANAPMGTPGYMSPELWIDAARVDPAADIYAFGCIAFEICCGRRPFEVRSIGDAYVRHTHDVPPRVRTLVADVPLELDDLIARALAKDPAARPSAHELHVVFAALADSMSQGLASTLPLPPFAVTPPPFAVTPPPLVVSPPARRTWRASLVIAVIAGVIAGASGGVYALTQPRTGATSTAIGNAWVRVPVPATPVVLGIRSDTAPIDVHGFRPSRKITSPSKPYDLQAHEVTWSELEPWLLATHTSLPTAMPVWAADANARHALPVTGVPWQTALAYCASLGGWLPTEEQWEYAARGPGLRANTWGADRLDRNRSHAYAGKQAIPAPVQTSEQDQTPDPVLYDLETNVQEWTLGLWRDSVPDTNEAWVAPGKQTSIRAIRGLPLDEDPPSTVQDDGAAYREELCATGPCVEQTFDKLRYVGFRCARTAR